MSGWYYQSADVDTEIAALQAEVDQLSHAMESLADALSAGGSKRSEAALDVAKWSARPAAPSGGEG